MLVARRQEAMEAARRKMQEELDAKAAIFREKRTQVQYCSSVCPYQEENCLSMLPELNVHCIW